MRITPLDVRKQEFRKGMRGLDTEEVYAFLATVADEYEAVLNDNKALRERLLELDDKVQEYRSMEKTLRDTLLTAERVTVDAKDNARREANIIVKEAQIEAEKALRDIKGEAMKLRQQIQQLRSQREAYLGRMKVLAEAHINYIGTAEEDFRGDDRELAELDVAVNGAVSPRGGLTAQGPGGIPSRDSVAPASNAPESPMPSESPAADSQQRASQQPPAAASQQPDSQQSPAPDSQQPDSQQSPAAASQQSAPPQAASPSSKTAAPPVSPAQVLPVPPATFPATAPPPADPGRANLADLADSAPDVDQIPARDASSPAIPSSSPGWIGSQDAPAGSQALDASPVESPVATAPREVPAPAPPNEAAAAPSDPRGATDTGIEEINAIIDRMAKEQRELLEAAGHAGHAGHAGNAGHAGHAGTAESPAPSQEPRSNPDAGVSPGGAWGENGDRPIPGEVAPGANAPGVHAPTDETGEWDVEKIRREMVQGESGPRDA